MNWMMLYGAITLEVCGTASLKLSNGLENLNFFAIALSLYAFFKWNPRPSAGICPAT
ncbi:MAG: hypothetical protein HYR49_11310 [Gammaproteobacteria bacterium]|nr:hypothetical protein [Gammaproteobacteria bacterium]